MFFKQYDALTRQCYNLINCGVFNSTPYKYISYGYNITKVYFPKVSYQNPYDPEYTKPSVKYNWIIVSGLIGFTFYATKAKVNSYYQWLSSVSEIYLLIYFLFSYLVSIFKALSHNLYQSYNVSPWFVWENLIFESYNDAFLFSRNMNLWTLLI